MPEIRLIEDRPAIPYNATIPKGFTVGTNIKINGRFNANAKEFHIDLKPILKKHNNPNDKNIALHFCHNFQTKKTTICSYQSGHVANESCHISHSLQIGKSFNIFISSLTNGFEVQINSEDGHFSPHIFSQLDKIQEFSINGEVILQSIKVENFSSFYCIRPIQTCQSVCRCSIS